MDGGNRPHIAYSGVTTRVGIHMVSYLACIRSTLKHYQFRGAALRVACALLAGLAAGIFPCLVSSRAGTEGAWHVSDMFLRGRSAVGSHEQEYCHGYGVGRFSDVPRLFDVLPCGDVEVDFRSISVVRNRSPRWSSW
ncbi:unnamed protein product [Ectocarpus sp. CCAP 1310/34]|nr:unnamed protein product [Ectocarpus sp. CCAP 1310/34]